MRIQQLLAVAVLPALAVLAFASAQGEGTPRGATAAPATKVVAFTGKSINGNLQEALNDALSKAQQAQAKSGVADGQFRWKLATVNGTRGGIAGVQETEVTIELVR